MARIDIDGRGNSIQEAVQDLWNRFKALEDRGYHPISSVEIVDSKTKKVIESYQLTDREFMAHVEAEQPRTLSRKTEDHKPPEPHEFAYRARLSLES